MRFDFFVNMSDSLDIPDAVYNWMVDFFTGRGHCTRYGGSISAILEITASTVQGPVVGPASSIINAFDLSAVHTRQSDAQVRG